MWRLFTYGGSHYKSIQWIKCCCWQLGIERGGATYDLRPSKQRHPLVVQGIYEIFKADLKLIAPELLLSAKGHYKYPKQHTKSTKEYHWWNMPNFKSKMAWIYHREPDHNKIAVFSVKSYTTYGKSIMGKNRKIWLSNKLHPKLF